MLKSADLSRKAAQSFPHVPARVSPSALIGRLLSAIWRPTLSRQSLIKLADLIPWDELEDYYVAQFCKGFGAPAKPFRMALGALIIKARLNLTDEELVEQIKENPCLQFFISLEASDYATPFDPSMMIYFR